MKHLRLLIYICILILLFYSCSSLPESGHTTKSFTSFKGEKVLLVEPLFLQELLGIEDEQEKFVKNLYVGNIEFSGGVIQSEEKGMMVQTKHTSFNRQAAYRDQALQTFSHQIRTAADTKNYNAVYLEREELGDIVTGNGNGPLSYGDFRITIDYREHKDDDKDNINLPWYLFSVTRLSSDLSDRLQDASGARYLLLPVIEHYYSHSAGWFNDQWSGCGAGLRITYHIVIFDLTTGGTVFHFSDMEKYLEEFSSRISEFLLLQEFANIEKRIQKTVMRKLPRG